MVDRIIPATDREQAIASFARLVQHFLPGKELVVTVDEAKHERTAKQRASLFGVAYKALMEQMGLRGEREKNDLHEFLLGEYFGWIERPGLGVKRFFPARTTTIGVDGKRDVLSTREQLAFYAWIQQRAAECGYDVPDPSPLWRQRAALDAEMEGRCKHGA